MKLQPLHIETERLLIRAYTLSDARALYELVKRNHYALIGPMPLTLSSNTSVLQSRKFILARNTDRRAGQRMFSGIFLRETAQLIGQIAIIGIDERVPKCELGYLIDARQQRKGYASEAVLAMLHHGFNTLQMQKIGLRIEPQNAASNGVARKCGFTKTGYLRHEFRAHDGRLMDVEWWELLRDEFTASKS